MAHHSNLEGFGRLRFCEGGFTVIGLGASSMTKVQIGRVSDGQWSDPVLELPERARSYKPLGESRLTSP